MAEKSDTVTMKKDTLWKIVAGILFLAVVVMYLNKGGVGTTQAQAVQPAQGNQDPFPVISVDMKKLADDDPILGKVDAPITIIEFSDFQCPFCKKFFTDTESQIIKDYIDTGKARFIYRDFPLSFHQNAEKAAEAAECAFKQGKFWEMHNAEFKASQGDGTGIAVSDLKKMASDLGLDTTKFNACLDSGETAAEIQKDEQDGSAIGIQGTPGFAIGKTDGNSARTISGAYPYAAFQQVIAAVSQA